MKDSFLQFLGLAKKAGYLIEGYNKCEEAFKRQSVFLLIISSEASANTKTKFEKFSDNIGIPCIQGYDSEDLGKSIGRPEISILCVIDKNMSEKLIALYSSCQNNRG